MALTHNQINRLWYNPSYVAFKKSSLVRQIFATKDAEDFIRTGAYLINEAEKLSNIIIPWNQERRLEILSRPRLENAFISIGGEYFLKGIYLKKGYAINKILAKFQIARPVALKNNRTKLDPCDIETFDYIADHLPSIINFDDYNKAKLDEEKKAVNELKGQKLEGITRMTTPYPNARKMLDYLQFKRNHALHRPFIVPEFRGITMQTFRFYDYISQQILNKTIKELAVLSEWQNYEQKKV